MLKQPYGARGTDTPWYRGWNLTPEQRAVFRATTLASQAAKRRALSGECDLPKHPINTPLLDPLQLMPLQPRNGLKTLSLFSGGGGMDIGFDRAGFVHAGSFELLSDAAAVIRSAQPKWKVFGGDAGDVTRVNWSEYRGGIDVLHGGPPCQPFSHAGRQNGAADVRNLIPEFVRAVQGVRPAAFVCENVSGLVAKRFEGYVRSAIIEPLKAYVVQSFCLEAADFGVPQRRRRVFFVGFADREAAARFEPPNQTHTYGYLSGNPDVPGLPRTMGARAALGLPEIGSDSIAPTLRSGLTGPRHTTSVVNSVTALRQWNALQIWPNGVAPNRAQASMFAAKNGHFRLSVPDCLVLQGFPKSWPVSSPVYFALGMIGNSVAPPMAYRLARAVAAALRPAKP